MFIKNSPQSSFLTMYLIGSLIPWPLIVLSRWAPLSIFIWQMGIIIHHVIIVKIVENLIARNKKIFFMLFCITGKFAVVALAAYTSIQIDQGELSIRPLLPVIYIWQLTVLIVTVYRKGN